LMNIVHDARQLSWRETTKRAGEFLFGLIPGLMIAYAVMALVWPWSVVSPLNPLRAAAYFSNFFEKPWKEMFDGALLLVPDMPRSYVPRLFLLEMPEVMIVLGVGGIIGALIAATRRDLPAERRAIVLFLAIAVIAPVFLTVI